jgi:serine/threonine protein kinase
MAPQITSWDNLSEVWEQRDDETGEVQTSFALFDSNESFYYGMLEAPKSEITFDQVTKALNSVPDKEVFTRWPAPGIELIQAPATLTEDFYIKRPNPQMYKVMKEHNALSQLSAALLAEAEVLQSLSQNPHPNIIRYHGCRVLRGYFIGIVLDRHPYDLHNYLKNRVGTIEKRSFIAALESALLHLHAHGLAHNDLTPHNILVSKEGMPILTDFGGCQPIGTYLKHIRGTHGWIDGEIKDHNTSRNEHDVSALAKISAWLDDPVFDQ